MRFPSNTPSFICIHHIYNSLLKIKKSPWIPWTQMIKVIIGHPGQAEHFFVVQRLKWRACKPAAVFLPIQKGQ